MTLQMALKMVGESQYDNLIPICTVSHVLSDEFLGVYKRAQETPQKKYDFPQTEAQEIGWDTKPLVSHVNSELMLIC